MDDSTRDADRIRMNSNDLTTRPDRAAFRDAVRNEDPSSWGDRTARADDTTIRDTTVRDTTVRDTTPRDTTITRDTTLREAPIARRDDTVLDERGYTVGSAPIVGERVVDRVDTVDRVAAEPPVERRRFSLGATFLGWAVATFFSLVFLAIVAGILGGNALTQYYGGDTTLDTADVNNYGIGALVGILVATFAAYLIGGYAAGRISLWDGAKHGALMIIWPILFGIIGLVVGTSFGDDLAAALGINFDLSGLSDLTGPAILGIVLTLAAMLAGGALGGRFGERYHDRADDLGVRRRTVRGRPL